MKNEMKVLLLIISLKTKKNISKILDEEINEPLDEIIFQKMKESG